MKLTKADIDKVRHIEGFPIAKDEDIIALSRPPYYTACPNPFIEDFIRENGAPYDEATDDYHREPFAADVSEGKNDPIYNAHSYHTKVPYKAIMRYILHYTKPGDIVFDGFCGTGMTGVAAQMCGCPDPAFKAQIEQEMEVEWGARKAVLNDLSPAATFIAYNYNMPVDVAKFEKEATRILAEVEKECGWMYETRHLINGYTEKTISGEDRKGRINYTVWSDVFICPTCSKEMVFWDVAVDKEKGNVRDLFNCPHCASQLKKTDCVRAQGTHFDNKLNEAVTMARQVPVLINYSVGKNRYEKTPDEHDIALIEKIDAMEIPYWYPTDRMCEGGESRRNDKYGITHVHHFYTNRNLYNISVFAKQVTDRRHLALLTAVTSDISKMSRVKIGYYFKGGGGPFIPGLSGTLYIPSLSVEKRVGFALENRLETFSRTLLPIGKFHSDTQITTSSLGDTRNMPSSSVDYVFTDPPFGGNLNYSELNFLCEAWLKVITNQKTEAIVNAVQGKGLPEYQALMTQCFGEYYRVLKPDRWITIEFHNSQNSVWNAIQEALQRVGFIVADIRTLDKQQGSFKQLTSTSAVKQDLVISAYKPKESFVREFQQRAGDPDMAWAFVRQHLTNVPIAPDAKGIIEVVAERQDYLLFDRMVAYHIMNGIPVPMDAHTFYMGLRQRFLMRDGMFFLPDQVNEYDEKRTMMELDETQLAFVISDEKSVIQWLNYQLSAKTMTYSELQPMYLQELHQSKYEALPELMDMLRDSFLQDEKGRWYVPDLSNAADLAKLRNKKLVKEFFDTYATGTGKLKVFRLEAIRAGFDECWKERNYALIAKVGGRLPEAVLQEDPSLLMYYDNACGRL